MFGEGTGDLPAGPPDTCLLDRYMFDGDEGPLESRVVKPAGEFDHPGQAPRTQAEPTMVMLGWQPLRETIPVLGCGVVSQSALCCWPALAQNPTVQASLKNVCSLEDRLVDTVGEREGRMN